MMAHTAIPAHAGPAPPYSAVNSVVGKKKMYGKLVPQTGLSTIRKNEALRAAPMPTA